jgi:hypothetical protein
VDFVETIVMVHKREDGEEISTIEREKFEVVKSIG